MCEGIEEREHQQRLKETLNGQNEIIRDQQEIIRKQKEEAEKQEKTNQELILQWEDIKQQMRDQLKHVQQQLEATIVGSAVTPPSTFAEVARSSPSPQHNTVRSVSSGSTAASNANELFCMIDTSRAIESEVRTKEGQATWRDEVELQRVKEAAQKTAVTGARVMRDQLYPVKVDNVNRTAILDGEGNILQGAAEALGAENNVSIGKITWLSNKETSKAYGSMVVYVTKKNDAKKLLDGKYFDLAGESACTNPFEPRKGPMQCFNCQEMGHKAFRCKKPQLNVRKREPVQQSLMNDEDLKDYGVLAVSEPYARMIDGKVVTSPRMHSNWTRILPTHMSDGPWPIRSMLWVRDDVEVVQMPMPSADLTAAVLRLPERSVLVVSVYVEGQSTEALKSTTGLLHDLIQRFRQGSDQESTIDLVLTTSELADEVATCAIHPTDHGSDHRAIQTTFDITMPERSARPRLLFKNAPWNLIRTRVKDNLRLLPWAVDVQTQTDQLMRIVLEAIHELTPRARPSPYAKRWWTKDLTQLRRTHTFWRNQARTQRRGGQPRPDLERRAKEAAKEFHDAIRHQRKAHWDDFLSDDANIWKATKYLKAGKSTTGDKVPPLRKGDGSTTEDKADQADELLIAFFPPLPARIEDEGVRPQRKAVPMPGLTLGEIEEKVMTAKPWKAPGEDELPTAVWRQLWPVTKDRIFALFDASLRDGVVPRQWKSAKIVPLKKPHKDDYTVAKAWRPISLLSTLARKRRSAEQALLLLQEQAYKAWRNHKVLSLISFDVKGAYNGVCKDRLLERMKARGIPAKLRRIKAESGSIAFVDDYSAWVTGPTAEANREGIQAIIDDALEWEVRSGQEDHMMKAAASGLSAAMGLRRLKGPLSAPCARFLVSLCTLPYLARLHT
ncbi:endonuclease-reverse transcriptase domain-containing protein [Hirsutella rhossiliensis]|uniref:Endonuclease-reverse transcriptase domain-containing protein n=1 Tax=Hirsutella rhossiliensis TaxID=111463 RepID=A0A9P8MWR7_9HYPO|nr:endonuclease-reverse transcriptase domain-containing protein [Hirsutella rhossiliensis]KAH0962655.1 endonuclease-reverse transcriptase domain-containing protein [Hirsutella rhossiliensis]